MDWTPVATWLYVITGFTQTRATRSRLVDMWKELYDQHARPETLVCLRRWNSNWRAEAEHVLRLADDRDQAAAPTIRVFAYSWGAGWGFTRFADQLGRRGLRVETAVLSDPVYRHPYWLGQWRALIPSWPIVIPANVGELHTYYQDQDTPRGHKLVCRSTETVLHTPIRLQASHAAMDEQVQFLTHCRLVAKQRAKPHLTIFRGDER